MEVPYSRSNMNKIQGITGEELTYLNKVGSSLRSKEDVADFENGVLFSEKKMHNEAPSFSDVREALKGYKFSTESETTLRSDVLDDGVDFPAARDMS